MFTSNLNKVSQYCIIFFRYKKTTFYLAEIFPFKLSKILETIMTDKIKDN